MNFISRNKLNPLFLAAVVGGLALIACGDEGGGGEPPIQSACGEEACGAGTSCNEENGRCECTSAPEDSCAPFGKICNSRKICVEDQGKEEPPVEGSPCAQSDVEEVDGLACADPFGRGDRRWARICTAGGHCSGQTSACVADGSSLEERSVCWENGCGDDAVEVGEGGEPVFRNGENWGVCDVNIGVLDSPEADPSGTCLPRIRNGKTSFLCQTSGLLAEDATCLGEDVERYDESGQCSQGMNCFPTFEHFKACQSDVSGICLESQTCDIGDCVPMPGTVCPGTCIAKECTEDEICGADAYCGDDGRCKLLGRCKSTCNGGVAGAGSGEFGSCGQSSGSICGGGLPANAIELEHALGYCLDGCDIFGGEESCPDVEGARQTCIPAPTGDNPLAGTCAEGPAYLKEEGEECFGRDEQCGPGLTCRYTVDDKGSDVYRCLRLCACEGEGGWDPYGRCLTDAPKCDADQACVMIQIGNPHLGVCLSTANGGAE